jgi:ATP-dependent Zn protease
MQIEQSKSERDQRGAAFHEAGHAVVAWTFGLSVGRLEIAIDDDDAKGAADIEQNADLSLLDQLAICAAGLESQKLVDAPTHEGAGWGDYGNMVELLEHLEEEDQFTMVRQGHKRASELVSANRPKVERLAIALIQKKRLGADEVAKLLAD